MVHGFHQARLLDVKTFGMNGQIGRHVSMLVWQTLLLNVNGSAAQPEVLIHFLSHVLEMKMSIKHAIVKHLKVWESIYYVGVMEM